MTKKARLEYFKLAGLSLHYLLSDSEFCFFIFRVKHLEDENCCCELVDQPLSIIRKIIP